MKLVAMQVASTPGRGVLIGFGVWDAARLAGHELSMPKEGLVGAVRGAAPRSKTSIGIMRPPQQGQVIAGLTGASASGLASAAGGGAGTSSRARALARLAARAALANRP